MCGGFALSAVRLRLRAAHADVTQQLAAATAAAAAASSSQEAQKPAAAALRCATATPCARALSHPRGTPQAQHAAALAAAAENANKVTAALAVAERLRAVRHGIGRRE